MGVFFVWASGGIFFIVIGIYAFYAKKPVRFWNVQKPVRVSDVKKYNRAVAKMWILFAVLFIFIGLPLSAGQNSAWAVIPILGGVWWAIALMVVYTGIEKKYRI